MSKEKASPADDSAAPAKGASPRARKVATPRPKKVAKVEAAADGVPEPASIPFPPAPRRQVEPARESVPSQSEASASASPSDWPEPEAESAGGASSTSEAGKRKRRRRKGKGQSGGALNQASAAHGEGSSAAVALPVEAKSAESGQEQRQRPAPQVPQQPSLHRPKIDPELLTKMAWKIYLAEIGEEGVALIGDNDAKELSRRCYRLAEIFIEEQSRRR
ncbi:MAG: hypothetical protein ORN51_14230 [Akkermansiaceae bacterium]|nr:hypothetical protein [Akkermansiaceae bacterium]